ncbi:MAG: hypothetical protein NZM44_07320, partial [Candidatus Calescibacterium sp.]|nr:hypothetical protein [Candidatus Calescibacterium sp.]
MEKFIKILKEKIKNINFNTQKCKRCLMDETASGISFSENGCNYCEEFLKIYEILTKNKPNLDDLKERIIRSKPINSKYDCIVGI